MKSKKTNKNQKRDFRFGIANLITEVRYHYNLTQVQLAKKMKTKQPSIARIESGSTLPSLGFLERLADSVDTYLVAPKFGFMIEENKSENKFDIKNEVPSQYYTYNDMVSKKLTRISI
jgi:transcriptional regulator with XRE-family HTH domain